jgi:hypothetical protein
LCFAACSSAVDTKCANQERAVKEFVERREVKTDRCDVRAVILLKNHCSHHLQNFIVRFFFNIKQVHRRQRFVEDTARTGLAQLSLVDEKVSRESKKYMDSRMSLSCRGRRRRGRGGFDKVHAQPI